MHYFISHTILTATLTISLLLIPSESTVEALAIALGFFLIMGNYMSMLKGWLLNREVRILPFLPSIKDVDHVNIDVTGVNNLLFYSGNADYTRVILERSLKMVDDRLLLSDTYFSYHAAENGDGNVYTVTVTKLELGGSTFRKGYMEVLVAGDDLPEPMAQAYEVAVLHDVITLRQLNT